jgi:hypothetical protein
VHILRFESKYLSAATIAFFNPASNMSTSVNEDRGAPRVILSFIERAVAESHKRREETSQGLTGTQTASAASNFSWTTAHDAATLSGIILILKLQMTKDKTISVVEKIKSGS